MLKHTTDKYSKTLLYNQTICSVTILALLQHFALHIKRRSHITEKYNKETLKSIGIITRFYCITYLIKYKHLSLIKCYAFFL